MPADSYRDLPPPDGGWGWVIVFSMFMMHVLNSGMFKSFGMVLDEFLLVFNSSTAETVWAFALYAGLYLMIAPISNTLAMKFSVRKVVTSASFLFTLGFLICLGAKNMTLIIIGFGLVSGLGVGLLYSPYYLSTGAYFHKRRSLANGLGLAGSGIGTMIFPPIIRFLLDRYSWWGTLLVLSAIVFNNCALGLLLRPIDIDKKLRWLKMREKDNLGDNELQNGLSDDIPGFGKPDSAAEKQQVLLPQEPSSSDKSDTDASDHRRLLPEASAPFRPRANTGHLPQHKNTDGELIRSTPVVFQSKGETERGSLRNLALRKKAANLSSFAIPSLMASTGDVMTGEQPYKKENAATCSNECLSEEEVHKENENDKKTTCSEWSQYFDVSLLKDYRLVMFLIAAICGINGFNCIYMMTPIHARDIGIGPYKVSLSVSVMGAADLLGRVANGWCSDLRLVDRRIAYGSCMLLCGLSCLLAPLATSYPAFLAHCAIFGFFLGSFYAVEAVCVIEIVGVEHISSALGLLFMPEGIVSLFLPTILGSIRDSTSSWNTSYVIVGALLVLGSAFVFGQIILEKCGLKPYLVKQEEMKTESHS